MMVQVSWAITIITMFAAADYKKLTSRKLAGYCGVAWMWPVIC